jgi:methyl-accepting chemotaxis protein
MKLRNMSIRTRLTLAFGALAATVLGVATLAVYDLEAANTRFNNYADGLNARAHVAASMRSAVDDRAVAARNLVLVSTPADLAVEQSAVTKAHQEVQKKLDQLNKMIAADPNASQPARDMVAEIGRIEGRYGPVALAIVDLALKQQRDQAITRMNEECRPLLAALIQATNAYARYTEERTQALQAQGHADYVNQRNLLIALSVLAVSAAIALGWFIGRSIVGPLLQAVRAINRVAGGDLTTPIIVKYGDETGQLLVGLQHMQQSLSATVSTVRGSAEGVSAASVQIAQGNNDLSQRTERQASALEETAASMEELGSTVHSNSDAAQQASRLAAAASEVAGQGSDVVGKVVATMKGINESSHQIAEITGVIDGIAFQTNILALNAAVEAARAGEQGRGFAVVAGEVRTLAQRSAQAAKEIKSLIGASVERVTQGSVLVDQAGATMDKLVASVKEVSDLMGTIGAASAEQSQGVAQIGEAISQMDQTTQQNAALVEEGAAAAATLELQARALVQSVAVFRIDEAARARQAATEAASHLTAAPDPVERRGPDRATNVTRLKPAASASPTKGIQRLPTAQQTGT